MTTTAMPRLGLGTWQLRGEDAVKAVRTALDLGYRHLDTAQMYRNEDAVGRGLADSGVERDEVWLTTKLDLRNLDPQAVRTSTERSLRDLGTDYVDLLLIHWPVQIDTVEATLSAMQQLRDRGLVRHVGVSNFTAAQLRRAAAVTDILTDQVEYHAMLDQTAVRQAAGQVGAVVTAYSPLGKGVLLDQPAVRQVAEGRGATPAQVALRWLLDQPDVVVIPKATGEAHLRDNLAALDQPPLDDTERATLDALSKDHRVIDPPFAPDWD